METLTVYWLTLKYWAGGTPLREAYVAAVTIVFWKGRD
jgi:hypothetical protein